MTGVLIPINSWFSPDGVAALTGATVVVGGAIGTWLRSVDAKQRERLDDMKVEISKLTTKIENGEAALTKETLDSARTYLTKNDFYTAKTEILDAMKAMENRIIANVKLALDALAKETNGNGGR